MFITLSSLRPLSSKPFCKASAWLIVLGKPSSKNPFLQSSFDNLSQTKSIVSSSGTNWPLSKYDFTFFPSSVSFLILCLKISPV